ncbi:TIGR01906 family membrane protein [Glutamicibacter sp.]|uniref:TIGR01906 family membrane protein n=1 Tax=Glutamicibacter sp. TaxID=1931995 RepID=UPI0028BE3515|nr:TIGR01906 family membrane protein [Glutamicibacter sp.]
MADAAKDPNGASEQGTTQTPKAPLSQKAEELAARLEAHKNMAQADAAAKAEAERKADLEATFNRPAAPAKPKASGRQESSSAKTAAAPAAASAAEPAKTTVMPEAKSSDQSVEDVIRAIKLPHEAELETQGKPQASAAKPAAAAASAGAAAAKQDVPAPKASVPPVAASKDEVKVSTAAAVAEARSRVFGSQGSSEAPSEAAMKRRVARDRALNSKPALARPMQILVAIIFPVLTLIAAIRLVATPGFLAFSYARPGFPADLFGFTAAQRLTYGSYGVDYLNNFAGPEYLAGLVLPNGSLLFTEGEVQHMVDVKNLIGFAYVLGIVLAVLFIIGIWYLAARYAGGVRRALFSGALVTLGLMALLMVAALTGWERFFSGFHALFFSEGSWTFSVQDTLIRLYPEQFWMDSAMAIAGMVLLTVVIVLITCWPTGRRREAARLRQEARAFGLTN